MASPGSALSLACDGGPAVSRVAADERRCAHAGAEAEGTSALAAGQGDRPHAVAVAATHEPQNGAYKWPAVSFPRMRAGLRSALKTECSGFKFQNGGRSLRWFRGSAVHDGERARLFWQAHVSLFKQHWDVVKPGYEFPVWTAFDRLDRAYRERYIVRDLSSRSGHRHHTQAMLADSCVERAVRWGLDPQNGIDSTLLLREVSIHPPKRLLALALEGGWAWLLERWQAVVESEHGADKWRSVIATAAIETGCLPLLEKYWPHMEAQARIGAENWRAIGRSGSPEMFDWLVEHSAAHGAPGSAKPSFLLQTASEYGHVALMEHAASRVPAIPRALRTGKRSFLVGACRSGHLHVVEWLVAQGATPTAGQGRWAVLFGHHAIVRYLCERCGITSFVATDNAASTLLYQSTPRCLGILEYLVQHLQHVPTSQNIIRAATSANVRSDVLRFLAQSASRETWDGACTDETVRNDLDVQDLLHAAAREVWHDGQGA